MVAQVVIGVGFMHMLVGIQIMKIFKDKHFKYEMQSLDAYYECILSCEINPCSSSWQGVEEDCETKCLNEQLKSHFM